MLSGLFRGGMNTKKLPIGIQTFANIRQENCYYVDKTAFILKLRESGKHLGGGEHSFSWLGLSSVQKKKHSDCEH